MNNIICVYIHAAVLKRLNEQRYLCIYTRPVLKRLNEQHYLCIYTRPVFKRLNEQHYLCIYIHAPSSKG